LVAPLRTLHELLINFAVTHPRAAPESSRCSRHTRSGGRGTRRQYSRAVRGARGGHAARCLLLWTARRTGSSLPRRVLSARRSASALQAHDRLNTAGGQSPIVADDRLPPSLQCLALHGVEEAQKVERRHGCRVQAAGVAVDNLE